MARSRCEVGSHQPVREYEYRVIYYLATANEPRWVADYHNALDSALNQLDSRRSNGDETAQLQECTWRTTEVGP